MTVKDPFAGIWRLNLGRSQFSTGHSPSCAAMSWERTSQGYLMRAEGRTREGKLVEERPQALVLDGIGHPIPSAPGLSVIAQHPDPNTIRVETKNADHVVGEGSYIVSADGSTLTACVSGIDAQQRPFQIIAVWDRQ